VPLEEADEAQAASVANEASAMKQFHDEALEKQKRGLAETIDWETLKALPDGQFPEAL